MDMNYGKSNLEGEKMAQDWDHLLLWHHDVNVKIVKIVGVGMVTHENPNSSTTITGLGLSEELHLGYFPLFGTFPERFNQISWKKRLGMIWQFDSCQNRNMHCRAERR